MKNQICSSLWKKRKRGRGRKQEKKEIKKKKEEKSLVKFSEVKRLCGTVSLDKKKRQFCQFITSNTFKFKKRLQQLSAEETGEIIDKDKEKVKQSKKKLKGNTDKMLKAKKSNAISKTIPVGKEKSGRVSNSRGVPSPSSSTSVPPPSPSSGVPSLAPSTGVQSVPPSKGVLKGVPGLQAKKVT